MASILLNRRETARCEPSQQHVELNFAPFVSREVCRRRRRRALPFGRPIAPAPFRLRLCYPMPVQRLEQRVLTQTITAIVHESKEIGGEAVPGA